MGTNSNMIIASLAVLSPLPMVIIVWLMWRLRNDPGRRQAVLSRLQVWPSLGFATVYVVFIGWLRQPGSFLFGVVDAIPMAGVIAASGLWPRLRARVGTEPRCAKCEYDLSGVHESDGSSIENGGACPECGAGLKKFGATIAGHRAFSTRLAMVIVMLHLPFAMSVGGSLLGGPLVLQANLLRFSPTGSLIAHVTGSRSFTTLAWDELKKRPLTAGERDTLAAGLLTRSARQLHSGSAETDWLLAESTSGQLSKENRQRALRRFVSIRLFSNGDGITRAAGLNGDQAWGLGGLFAGYSIVTVRGEVRDGKNLTVMPSGERQLGLSSVQLARSPPLNQLDLRGAIDGLDALVTLPPGCHTSVWVIARPDGRDPGTAAWFNGVPVVEPEAISVRFDLE